MTPTFLSPPVHFTRDEFRAYVNGLRFVAWTPRMPYLHNTGAPSLKQWLAYGATPQERWGANLDSYYKGLGWHASPHLVACPDYIWVLCEPTAPGVAQSCSNAYAFAQEMVGDFEVGGDDFSTGAGAKVRDNAAFAFAVMAEKLGWGDLADYAFNERGLHFHHDCASDHHACPGSKVTKPDMLARVAAFRAELAAAPLPPAAPRLIVPPAPVAPERVTAPKILSADDIQAALNRLGAAPPLVVDGAYGAATRAAVEAFQAEHGCFVDGWAGQETCAAIEKALAG